MACFFINMINISKFLRGSEYPLWVYIHPSKLNFSSVCPFKFCIFVVLFLIFGSKKVTFLCIRLSSFHTFKPAERNNLLDV